MTRSTQGHHMHSYSMFIAGKITEEFPQEHTLMSLPLWRETWFDNYAGKNDCKASLLHKRESKLRVSLKIHCVILVCSPWLRQKGHAADSGWALPSCKCTAVQKYTSKKAEHLWLHLRKHDRKLITCKHSGHLRNVDVHHLSEDENGSKTINKTFIHEI